MTPERFKRCKAVLARRQPDLTVLMDNVHKPHNLSAIVRSCDAVGIFDIHAVSRVKSVRTKKDITAGSGKWVDVHLHPDLQTAARLLKQENMQILAAHPDEHALDYRQVDYTKPTAILLGQELDGVTDEGLALADQHVVIPMLGMVDSLNVSVAAALILFEAQRQRLAAGLYQNNHLDQTTYNNTLFEWSHPKMAAFYSSKGLAYPGLDDDGNIIESEEHTRARLAPELKAKS
jgi:tRNA (guanosine-2'-O-)-methyltransferase